jgi:hypothetical protein
MMRRKVTLTIAAIGGALSLLLGSGLISLVSDSVTSEANSLESGTFSPASYDLKLARVLTESCAAVPYDSYQDGPLTALFTNGTLDLSQGRSNVNRIEVCLRNLGNGVGKLVASNGNYIETEIGGCEPSESEAGDTTCGDGDHGELFGVLSSNFFVSPLHDSSPSCTGAAGHISSQLVLDQDLAPGESCRIVVDYRVDPTVSDNDRLLAQTDRLQWDITFTLEDATA